ncbi:hypothetical protein Tco_0929296 [Tanacetum coccineum]
MKHGFLSSGRSGVKQKKGTNTVGTVVNKDMNDESVMDVTKADVNNDVPVSALFAKITDMERQLLDGKLVLVDDDGVPVHGAGVTEAVVGDELHHTVEATCFTKPNSFMVTRVAGKSFDTAMKKVLTQVVSSVVVEDTFKDSSHQGVVPSNSNGAYEASQTSTKSSPISFASLCREEYEWKHPRCGVCMVFGHDDSTCSKRVVDDTRKENLKSNDGFQNGPRKTFRGFNTGLKVHFKPSKQVGLSNPFNVLNSLENDVDSVVNDVGKVDPKVIVNPKVASCVEHIVTSSSNVNEAGKSSEMVIDDNESDMEDVCDETAQFMARGGANDASLLEDEDYDIYDGYDLEGLSKEELAFCEAMDFNLRGRRTMAGVDIDTLTMEQYLALSRENQAPGVVKPKIEGNVNFKIKSQFMGELREDSFSGNKDEDAHDLIDRVLSIVGLFNIPRVTKDAVML